MNEKIVPIDEIRGIVNFIRCNGRNRIVTTNGIFDMLNIGHVRYLQKAASYGDILIVGVNSDYSVRLLNAGNSSVSSQDKRVAMLAALEVVDYVVLFSDPTPSLFLTEVRPDIHVKGGDYKNRDIPERGLVESLGGRVEITDYYYDESVSRIVQQLVSRNVDVHNIFPTIVSKEWGYEFWVRNDEVCYKLLVINPGCQGSLHYHEKKSETFTVMRGSAHAEFGVYDDKGFYIRTDMRELKVDEHLSVNNMTMHRLSNTGDDLVVILEQSSHHDDADTYRLAKE